MSTERSLPAKTRSISLSKEDCEVIGKFMNANRCVPAKDVIAQPGDALVYIEFDNINGGYYPTWNEAELMVAMMTQAETYGDVKLSGSERDDWIFEFHPSAVHGCGRTPFEAVLNACQKYELDYRHE